MPRTPKQQIKHFLKTGHADQMLPPGWPGDLLTSANNAADAMKSELIEEVHRRTLGLPVPKIPELDLHAFARGKFAPMVDGLFPEAERPAVLSVLEKSIVFLTADNIDNVLQQAG